MAICTRTKWKEIKHFFSFRWLLAVPVAHHTKRLKWMRLAKGKIKRRKIEVENRKKTKMVRRRLYVWVCVCAHYVRWMYTVRAVESVDETIFFRVRCVVCWRRLQVFGDKNHRHAHLCFVWMSGSKNVTSTICCNTVLCMRVYVVISFCIGRAKWAHKRNTAVSI